MNNDNSNAFDQKMLDYYSKILNSSFENRKEIFLNSFRTVINCYKVTGKDLFSHEEIIKIITSDNELSSYETSFLLLKLTNGEIYNIIDKVDSIGPNNLFKIVDDFDDKNKIIIKLISCGKLSIFDLIDKYENGESYIDYLTEDDIINIIDHSDKNDDKYDAYYSEVVKYAFNNKYDNLFDYFIINKDKFKSKLLYDLIKLLSDDIKLKYVDSYFKIYGLSKENIEYIDENVFIRDDSILYSDNIYTNLIDAYIDYYHLNRENFYELFSMVNYVIFPYLRNENIRNIINMDSKKLNKLLDLFNEDSIMLNNDTINTVLNAFLQRKFRIDEKEKVSIFDYFETIISSYDYSSDSIKAIIGHIIFDDPELSIYLKDINVNELCKKIKNGDKESINFVHDFTNKYIALEREKYVKEYIGDYYDYLNIGKIPERNYYKKRIIQTNRVDEIIRLARTTHKFDDFVVTKEFENIIYFKKDPYNNKLSDNDKKYLKLFEDVLNAIYEKYKYKYEIKRGDKFVYEPIIANNFDLLDILSEVDSEIVSKHLLDDDKLCNKLNRILNKYKLLGWGHTFDEVSLKCDVDIGPCMVGSLINNFYVIDKETNIEDYSISKIIDYANCYDIKSIKYSKLFGVDNFKYIVSDPGPNKSTKSRNDKIEGILSLVKKAFKKEYITVPPIDKDYVLRPNKKVNICIGNVTNMMNFTYGERTGSCMRCGGVYEDLYNFCITDKNGFHIRFTDCNTGKLVSRVSGIRNGNTVFLNELRHSKVDDITDEDLFQLLMDFCNDLVTESYKSSDRIENILITGDYALSSYKTSPNELKDSYEALYGVKFNLFSNGDAIILYSEDDYLNYKFNRNIKTEYRTLRDKIVYYNDLVSARDAIYKIELLDRFLGGERINDIDINIDYDIKEAYVGEDFYIYIDSDNNYHTYIMNNSINKDRAIYEINNLNIDIGRGLK